MGGASEAHDGVYFASLSGRTMVYKGMLTTPQLGAFYPDLADPAFVSAIALVHSRFSTNTFPSWPLAHPYRFIAHNGEINTVRGNANWMRAREALLASPHFGHDIEKLFPICTPGASDTATFDEALELLHLGGYSLPEGGSDDDPGAVGESRGDARRDPGVLPLPRVDGRAVGRSGIDRVHRRNGHRCRPRSERPATEPLLGHRQRHGDHGERGGRRRRSAEQDHREGSAAAGSDVPDRHASGPDHPRRRDQEWARRWRTVRRLARRAPSGARCAARRPAAPRRRAPPAPPTGLWLQPRRAQVARSADGQERQGGHRLDGHRYAGRGVVEAVPFAVRLLPAAVRPGHEPATRRHP